ncbi:MAG: hypothetical protein CSA62_12205 [Planctomycetota bacterium]|nr:MAG: hypothetical protein CSA62_12205 [Planctomycetota bacterium]
MAELRGGLQVNGGPQVNGTLQVNGGPQVKRGVPIHRGPQVNGDRKVSAGLVEDTPQLPLLRIDGQRSDDDSLPPDADFESLERFLKGQALLFLSVGVVHKMNNVLAVFMSLTQIVEQCGPSRSPIRQAQDLGPYQQSVDKGLGVISLMSDLLPRESAQEQGALCLGPLLQGLAQTLLCEVSGVRYPVVCLSQPQVYTSLPRGRLTCSLLLLIEHVLREASSTFRGRLELRAEALGRQPSVCIFFKLPSDHLPFSIEHKPLPPKFLRYCRELGLAVLPLDHEPGYRLLLPGL